MVGVVTGTLSIAKLLVNWATVKGWSIGGLDRDLLSDGPEFRTFGEMLFLDGEMPMKLLRQKDRVREPIKARIDKPTAPPKLEENLK